MKFCPECGVKLISQKFCHECGCNIATYLSGGEGTSLSFGNESTGASTLGGGFESFDFSALQNAASQQLSQENEKKKFYNNAEVSGTALVKYKGSEETVVIPEGITTIKNSAFYYASTKTIKVPASVSEIEEISLYCANAQCYEVDKDNKHYKSIDGVVYSKDGKVLIQYPNGKSGYYNMPNEVEQVKRSAISGCVKLTGLSLSSRLTKIDDFMFCGTTFQTLEIPSNITSIGKNAFEMCTALTSITIPGSVVTIGSSAFSCCEGLRSVTINEGVVSIEPYAFFNCTSLTNVSIAGSVNSLGSYAFKQCRALQSITIPRGVSTVGTGAFAYCDSLSNVTLEEGVRAIESEAFNNHCLKSVKIPRSVQSISNSAFPANWGFSGGGFKMYVPRGRRYGMDTYGREFIDY